MSILLLGDSNVRRFVGLPPVITLLRDFDFRCCTSRSSFASSMSSLDSSVCVVSVLTNFIHDAAREAENVPEIDAAILEVRRFVSDLSRTQERLVSTRFIVVPPMHRFSELWYRTQYSDVLAAFDGVMSEHPNLISLPVFFCEEGDFEQDKIHLSEASGTRFIQFICKNVRLHIHSNKETGMESTLSLILSKLDRLTGLETLPNQVGALERRTSRVEVGLTGVSSSILRLAEDSDQSLNIRMEDVCLLSKLPYAGTFAEPSCSAAVKTSVQRLVRAVLPNARPIISVRVVRRVLKEGRLPLVHVRFATAEECGEFRRKSFPVVSDETSEFKGAFAMNWLALGSRIRVEIMRVLARSLSTDSNPVKVRSFSSRPRIAFFEGRSKVPTRTMDFCGMMSSYSNEIKGLDFSFARKLAGDAYTGGAFEATFGISSRGSQKRASDDTEGGEKRSKI